MRVRDPSRLLCLLVAVVATATVAVSETSNALWLELGQEGDVNDTVLTHDYIYDVTPYLPAGVFSATGAGVWLLYERDGYGHSGIGNTTVYLGSGTDTLYPTHNVTSVRQAGSPTIHYRSTLTLYAYTHFRGREMYVTQDRPSLGIFADETFSAIITGSDSWTVYTYGQYDGLGKCLAPDQAISIGDDSVMVGLFPDYATLGSSGYIRSVKMGCDDASL